MLFSGCWLWCAARSKDQSPERFGWELVELETIQTAEAATQTQEGPPNQQRKEQEEQSQEEKSWKDARSQEEGRRKTQNASTRKGESLVDVVPGQAARQTRRCIPYE